MNIRTMKELRAEREKLEWQLCAKENDLREDICTVKTILSPSYLWNMALGKFSCFFSPGQSSFMKGYNFVASFLGRKKKKRNKRSYDMECGCGGFDE